MPLDPGVARMLAFVNSLGAPPMETVPGPHARAGFRRISLQTNALVPTVEVGAVRDASIGGPAGPVPVRVYEPAELGEVPVPTVVFAHGGGWVVGDLDTHDPQTRRLCRDLGAVVVSVDYRLAPEHPYPAGLDDAQAVLDHVVAHIGEFGGDAARIAVAGDSAGGSIAAVLAQRSRDRGIDLAAQLLIYPSVDNRADEGERYPSRRENATGYLLTAALMRWFGANYIPDGDRTDPGMSPILGDLAGVAPAVVVTAEFDPLRDEGDAYAHALRDAGVDVRHRCFPGLVHGFFSQATVSPACEAAIADTITMLSDLLATPGDRAATSDR